MPDTSPTSEFESRPPVNDAMGMHPFVESEYPEGRGRCDSCGGGRLAAIHRMPLDNAARMADALEEFIVPALQRTAAAVERIALQLERWNTGEEGALDVLVRDKL